LTRFGRTIHLVDRDDDRDLGGLGVIDGLDGLFHDAVVGGHHQDHDVGHGGPARAHFGERRMARRIDEGDLVAGVQRDLIGADVLGDATGLVAGDVGRAQGVQKRGLAVVDVAHHRDHRRARLERGSLVGPAADAKLDVGGGNPLGFVAELLDHQFGGVGVDRLVDGRHNLHLHERLDHLHAPLGHAVRELLDRDGLGGHVADDALGRLMGLLGRQAA
jgi:hypothetical protein